MKIRRTLQDKCDTDPAIWYLQILEARDAYELATRTPTLMDSLVEAAR